MLISFLRILCTSHITSTNSNVSQELGADKDAKEHAKLVSDDTNIWLYHKVKISGQRKLQHEELLFNLR